MAKIVFIVNSLQNQRCIKRINEFIRNGADVEVYAYTRQAEDYTKVEFPITILGVIESQGSYVKRLPKLCKSIRNAIKKRHGTDNDIYYLFGLDIAMTFCLLHKKNRYIYEESDLVHTYVGNKQIRNVLEWIDKKIINASLKTVFTSEGFALYHFGTKWPDSAVIIPNKLNPSILKLDWNRQKKRSDGCIKVGFVGKPRFKSVVNFAKRLCLNSNNYEFHIYGGPILEEVEGFESLSKFDNYFYHGPFKNPSDLPDIYSSIDLVLSTYDIEFENVRYAEPNKIYECMFFNTPIIVSSDTFLSQKVQRLGIGFALNPLDDNEVDSFLNTLSTQSIEEVTANCINLKRKELIDDNTEFIRGLISM